MTKNVTRGAWLAAALAVAAAGPSTHAADGDAAAGKKVFAENCIACHSATTNQRGGGPGLKDLYKNPKLPSGRAVSDANVRKQILKGGGGMPGFEGSLTDAQIDDLIAYLKTL
jgi:mono/diheme cytochrome c family protein